ncbi:MAG: hypothetical protein ACOX9C_12155 [Kiritimatiellia bacterium]|jgi:hypothetical protein
MMKRMSQAQVDRLARRALVAACLLAVVCLGRVATGVPVAAESVKGLRLPLQRHANGRVQTLLIAEEAWMTEEGVAAKGGIQMFLMSPEGLTNGIAFAEEGTFNQKAKTARCIGPVLLKKEGLTLSGTNMLWDSSANEIIIESKPVLTITRSGRSVVEGP